MATMEFKEGPKVILDFGKKGGGKLQFGVDFITDAIEHYLTHIITEGLKNDIDT